MSLETIVGFRLSPQQKHLWLLQQANQSQPYRAQCAVSLEGDLDVQVLKAALQDVVDRYEILHTVFCCLPGMTVPLQVVCDSKIVWDGDHDWSNLDPQQQQIEIDVLWQQARALPFDFQSGPLLHVSLATLAPQKHVLLIGMPALCADNASLTNLVREISDTYAAIQAQQARTIEDFVQYSMVSEWLNDLLESGDADAGRKFWSERKGADLLALQLAVELQHDASSGAFAPRSVARAIQPVSATRIDRFLKQHDVSAFTFFLTCWHILLWRLTQQPDICVGTSFSGRTDEELKPALGLFARYLPLHCHLEEDYTFDQLVKQASENTQDAESWQECFSWQDNLRGTSEDLLFCPVCFELTELCAPYTAAGLTFSICRQDACIDRFHLKISCVRTSDSFITEFQYDPNRFSPADIERLAEEYHTLLESVTTTPAITISEFEILGAAERQRLLIDFNATVLEFPKQHCIHHLFEAQVARTPENTAAVFEKRELTYRELNARANQLAHHLQSLGVGPEVPVALCVGRSLELLVGLLGILKAGGIYVPLDPEYPQERLSWILDDTKTPILLTQRRFEKNLPAHAIKTIYLDTAWDAIACRSAKNPTSTLAPENVAYIIYTSGSTGKPKGVQIPHVAIVCHSIGAQRLYQYTSNDRVLQFASPNFDASIEQIFTPLISGATVILRDTRVWDSRELLTQIANLHLTIVNFPPSYWHLLAQEWADTVETFPPEDLRLVIVGGDAITMPYLRLWWQTPMRNVRLLNAYGPTEATITATIFEITPSSVDAARFKRIPIGRPFANRTIAILDRFGRPTPIGVYGELCIGGVPLARGYLNRPDLTAERFIPNPFAGDKETRRQGDKETRDDEASTQNLKLKTQNLRLYRTGDLARYLPDSSIEFLGRSDHQVKIRGFRIELGEIESVLGEHPAAREAVVVAHEDALGDRRLVAYVVTSDKLQVTSREDSSLVTRHSLLVTELRDFLQQKLPEYMVPAVILLLDTLPLTPTGKVDRHALPDPDWSDPQSQYVAPRTPTEQSLAQIWTDVLKLERVGIYDNFFNLGGDSIVGIRMVARANQAGLKLTTRQIFQYQTIAKLAPMVETAMPDTAEQGAEIDDLPLTPIQQGSYTPSDFPLARMDQPALDRLFAMGKQIEDIYPLSPLQQGILFRNLYDPQSAVYSVQMTCMLHGTLDRAAFAKTWQQLVDRHSVLRTSFIWEGLDEPMQVVCRDVAVPLEYYDWRAHSADEQQEQLAASIQENRRRGFILSQAPLLLISLIQVDDTVHHLILTSHHIILEGWSSQILLREALTLYEANCKGIDIQLPASAPFRTYIAWLQQQDSTVAESFWRARLRGFSTPITLPIDRRSKQARQEPCHTSQHVQLSLEATAALKTLTSERQLTMNVLLQGAWSVLLSRYSGQQDVLFGVTISGRPATLPGVEDMVGLFINTLPMRVQIKPSETLSPWLQQIQNDLLELQQFGFSSLVDIQGWSEIPRGTPLFENILIFENYPVDDTVLVGQHTLQLRQIGGAGHNDYPLSVIAQPGVQLRLDIDYDRTRYEDDAVIRMLGHLQTLLSAIAACPNQRLSDLPLLTETEQHQILTAWNATDVVYPLDCSLHKLIEAQAARTPDAHAVLFQDTLLTYRELNRQANQLANHLRAMGVDSDTLVGICVERSPDLVIGLLGILKAGGAYLPLDPTYPPERLAFMLEDAQVPMLLTQERLLPTLPPHRAQLLCLDRDAPTIACAPDTTPISAVTRDNLAYVIYTSGSSGWPKGVMITHRNVVNFFTAMDLLIGGDSPGVWLAVTSISFDISILELLWTLTHGFLVVVQAEPDRAATVAVQRPIAFSLFYFASDVGASSSDRYRLLLEGARFADRSGFSAIWTPERHFHPFGGLYPNPSVVSAAIAAVTERVQIRAGSVVLPLHHPIRVAEEWSVVDNLSNGRVGISFASGWHAGDFVFAPDHYVERRAVMMQAIDTVRALWRGEQVAARGGAGSEITVRIFPPPIQHDLPIWLTAAGNPETFRMAGEAGANLLTHLLGQSLNELANKIAIYRQAWRAHGHGPGDGHVTLMLHTFVGEDLEVVRETVRAPFCDYLRSSLDLIDNLARSRGLDITADSFTEADMEALLDHAFDRYFATSGLMGTPEICLQMIAQLQEIGVDEVACLIDFGIAPDKVLASLDLLNVVRERSQQMSVQSRARQPLPNELIQHQISHLQCTPSLARLLVQDPQSRAAMRSLRMLLVGGEPLASDLAVQLAAATPAMISNMYGPTETTIWSAMHLVADRTDPVPIGRPIANTQFYILDAGLRPVPIGVPGELYIGGDGLALGYLNRPDLTAERFIPNPFARVLGDGCWVLEGADSPDTQHPTPNTRLYRTGDFVRYLPDGNIEYLGRNDHQIKLRGYRIELGEIEVALSQHPSICANVVLAREDTPGAKRLVAYLVVDQVPGPAPAELRTFLKQRLPDYMLPSNFVVLEKLPLTPNGKIDRRALPVPQAAPSELHSDTIVPRTSLEQALAGIWAEVLGLEQFGIHDDFFALGGHSLSAIQVTVRIRRVLQIEIPLKFLFEATTVAELAQRIMTNTSWQGHIENTNQLERNTRDTSDVSLLPEHADITLRRTETAQDAWPLSFAQQQLWFLDRLMPNSTIFNNFAALRLTGHVNVAVLTKSIFEIISRHEILRTNFITRNGEALQVVRPSPSFSLPVIDLSALPANEREARIHEITRQEIQRPFNLVHDLLLRAILLRLDEKQHMLLTSIHHIICDGWSINIFNREITVLYEAFSKNQPSPLPELAIQYKDYASWQREWMQGEGITNHLAYWKQQLQGSPHLLKLRTDYPRPAMQSFQGANQPFALSQRWTQSLKQLCQQEKVTLFMTFLTAFFVLLHHYSEQDDIVVGTDVAGRRRMEIEPLIGFFINQLVLRANLSGNPTFRELLERVRQVTLNAYEHQDLPFEELVRVIRPERNLQHAPLFQAKIFLQYASQDSLQISDLQMQTIDTGSDIARLDLTVGLWETSENVKGWFNYATDLFSAATITCMVEQFEKLLQHITTQPDSSLDELDQFLSTISKERRTLQKQISKDRNLKLFVKGKRTEVGLLEES